MFWYNLTSYFFLISTIFSYSLLEIVMATNKAQFLYHMYVLNCFPNVQNFGRFQCLWWQNYFCLGYFTKTHKNYLFVFSWRVLGERMPGISSSFSECLFNEHSFPLLWTNHHNSVRSLCLVFNNPASLFP